MDPTQKKPTEIPSNPPPPSRKSDEQPNQVYEEDIPSDDQADEADGKSKRPSGGTAHGGNSV